VTAPWHRPLPAPAFLRRGPLKQGAFPSPLHDRRNAALLGYALGVCFTIAFITGLISHWIQHPPGWFSWPADPAWLYRVTQGVHVATGFLTVPLLAAKLWTVYPKLFEWPPARDIAHALERLGLLVLVGGSLLQVVTGVADVYHWYFFHFFFTPTHYFTAWVLIGALIVHIGAKGAIARDAVRRQPKGVPAPAAAPAVAAVGTGDPVLAVPGTPEAPSPLSRRLFLGGVGATAGLVTLFTVGESLSPLGSLDLLGARHPGDGAEHLPVNISAREAGVVTAAQDAGYQLSVSGRGTRGVAFNLAALQAMVQTTVRLPITCVEGWSADAVWSGVRLRDLLDHVGAPADAAVRVESLERHSIYASSVVDRAHTASSLTLLALRVNGKELDLDHGYPLRLIGPDRPGVMQTKWLTRVVVL
jgi:DMSO/TMAO reductase YedYZ molybdopterin-dependent catalytic subunit